VIVNSVIFFKNLPVSRRFSAGIEIAPTISRDPPHPEKLSPEIEPHYLRAKNARKFEYFQKFK
jgi:hypothetical protein